MQNFLKKYLTLGSEVAIIPVHKRWEPLS